jgi:hypothetical protein
LTLDSPDENNLLLDRSGESSFSLKLKKLMAGPLVVIKVAPAGIYALWAKLKAP